MFLKILIMKKLEKNLPFLYIIAGLIAFYYSFVIMVEKLALSQNADHVLPCDISPFISCGSVMQSPQAAVFGFPNPLLGIAGFAIVVTIGFALLSGAKFKRWFWQGVQLGMLFAVGFIYWLFHEAVFEIGSLCLYCMYVWAMTIPLFWYTTVYNIRQKYILASVPALARIKNWQVTGVLILMYLVIIASILHKFWYNWLIMFGLL